MHVCVLAVNYRIPEDFALSLRTVYLWRVSVRRELTECRTLCAVGKKPAEMSGTQTFEMYPFKKKII